MATFRANKQSAESAHKIMDDFLEEEFLLQVSQHLTLTLLTYLLRNPLEKLLLRDSTSAHASA
jgi:hypothetical protein